jgi:hypothetical protein
MWWHTRSPFKSARASVQSTASSRGVRISCSNAGYTTFRVVWRVLATHCIRQFPLNFPSCASRCAITIQLDCTPLYEWSARRRDFWKNTTLTTDRYPCPRAGFGPAIPASEWLQIHALDRAVTVTGLLLLKGEIVANVDEVHFQIPITTVCYT